MTETATKTKARPIMFSAPMVRAILAGKKHQTRRVLKDKPPGIIHGKPRVDDQGYIWWSPGPGTELRGGKPCPYGKPGDLLWVKEAWRGCIGCAGDSGGLYVTYEADGAASGRLVRDHSGDVDADYQLPKSAANGGLITPLYMPQGASRLTLRIKSVRVERLMSISAGDIIAEGVVARSHDVESFAMVGADPKCPVGRDDVCYPDLKSLWVASWNRINGKTAPAKSNPWVWVVSFELAEGGAA